MTIELIVAGFAALNVVVAAVAAYAAVRAIGAANASVQMAVLTRTHDALIDVEHRCKDLARVASDPQAAWRDGLTVDASVIQSLQDEAHQTLRSLARLGNDPMLEEYDRAYASFFTWEIWRLVTGDSRPVSEPDPQFLDRWEGSTHGLLDLATRAEARAADIDREIAAVLRKAQDGSAPWRRSRRDGPD